tara:strand:+ start:482 stop:1324 length:843 start_codon:yes stop_codon:yes gene_type:complete
MARFKGDSSGRNTVQYADAKVASACSDLCTYVNNEVSSINSNKLSTNGSGANLTGVVHSVNAGSGISVNQTTGAVTVTASGGSSGGPEILYACNTCWNGSVAIPSDKRGNFSHYEIMGTTGKGYYYCSQMAYCFEAWPGCQPGYQAGYCCAHCACGWMGDNKCSNGSWQYTCAGAIAWPIGCDSGCRTACSYNGYQWHNRISSDNPCSGGERGFRYCFTTSMNGDSTMCCIGVRNSGYAYPCCGMHGACLKGFCFSTPSGSNPFNCHSTVTVIGYGRLPV